MEAIFEILGAAIGIVAVISLLIAIFALVCQWKIFKKMGEPGWKCLIPIYNSWVEMKHTFGNGLFILVFFVIPLIPHEAAASIIACVLSVFIGFMKYRRFGKSTAISILLGCLPFIGDAICAFDKSEFNHDESLNFNHLFG